MKIINQNGIRWKVPGINIFAMALIFLIFPGSSLETDILMMTGNNLSLNAAPEFVISKSISTTEGGNLIQTINISSSTDSNANASLLFWALPFYNEDLSRTNSSAFSEFMENTMLGVFQFTGGKVVGEISAKNSWQRNVTAYSISIPKSKEKPNGEEFIFAAWPIDSRNCVMLISYLDQNTTTKIIETLVVRS